ncbi:MAG: PD-(D/E)XK nuclease family protein [Armatimonadia bacterium]
MKITNHLGLPAPLVAAAASNYEPDPREWRVTSLLKGTREAVLERRHAAEIERDAADMIWLVFGTAVHTLLAASTETEAQIKEERLRVPVGDYVLTGQFDLYDADEEVVIDYKTASVWKIIYGDFADWRRQLLIYAWILRETGFDCRAGQVVALLKDHSKREAKHRAGYPPYPVYVQRFEFAEADFVECKAWLEAKFAEIKAAEALPDALLPPCTDEERYNDGAKYAVMAKGKKRALRVLDSREEAEAWIKSNGGDSIEERPGEDKKCLEYCAAAAFCSHYQSMEA